MRNDYDEMQEQKRNKIGNETFSLLVILLMLDTFFFNLGFKWLDYPNNVFVIVIVCSGVFLIRSALNNSLIAPKQNIQLDLGKDIVIMLLSMYVVTIIAHFFENKENSAPINNNMGLILNILSFGIFIILVIISIVKNIHDNKHIK